MTGVSHPLFIYENLDLGESFTENILIKMCSILDEGVIYLFESLFPSITYNLIRIFSRVISDDLLVCHLSFTTCDACNCASVLIVMCCVRIFL